MEIIVDADVIIRGEKGVFDFREWAASRPDDLFEVAAITAAELWHGVERATGATKIKRSSYILPYTGQTAYEHARIWAELDMSGRMIGYHDLIVAATALEKGSQVATFNKRHFSRVNGLTVIEPE
jgi:tRNA(fMet)-specific endonuclease VapC